jgi:hypothetical protein
MRNILALILLFISMISIGQVDIERRYDLGSKEDYGSTDGQIRLHVDHMAGGTAVLYSFMNISFNKLTEMETLQGTYSTKRYSSYDVYRITLKDSVIRIFKFDNDKTVLHIHMNNQNYSTVYSGNVLMNLIES